MIIFQAGGLASVRRGEFTLIPGIRSRIRAVPYPGFHPPGAEPWNGTYRRSAEEMRVEVASDAPQDWVSVLAGAPPGCVLVGEIPPAEEVYGAARAVVSAALSLGRGVVLVGGGPSPVPEGEPRGMTALELWQSGEEGTLWERLRALRGRVAAAGVVLPLLPGWTAEDSFLERFLSRAHREGAQFAAALEVDGGGVSRAAIHADFAGCFSGRAEDYFGRLHHADWPAEIARGKRTFRQVASSLGLPSRVPTPCGSADFETNLLAVEALDVSAEESSEPEAARLRRAARTIEDLGRDLGALVEEGNERLLFEPGSAEWRVIQEAVSLSRARP